MPVRLSHPKRGTHYVPLWEELDTPNWRKEEEDDSPWDTIEAFFVAISPEFHRFSFMRECQRFSGTVFSFVFRSAS